MHERIFLSDLNKQGKINVAECSHFSLTYCLSTLNAYPDGYVHKSFICNYPITKKAVLISTKIYVLPNKTVHKYRVKWFFCVDKLIFFILPLHRTIAVEISIHNFPSMKLANDKINIQEQVNMLFGTTFVYGRLRPGQIRASNANIILQETAFGIVVSRSFLNEN